MPDPVKTTCPYCGVGCGLLASIDDAGVVSIKGDPEHPANLGRLCSKGSALGETVYLQDRLQYPIAHGEQVSWDHAIAEVAGEFSKVIDRHGPDAVAFYVSGQLLTEDYYVANKLMKGAIGSGNIDTNSRLCMSSAVAAHKRAFGEDCVPACYEDIELADLVVLAGSNAAWCHPVLYQRLAKAKKERPGLQVVLIDPRRTQTADIADLHLAIKPGMDAVLWNGLLLELEKAGAVDTAFVGQHTKGLEEALDAARASTLDMADIARQCGLAEADVASFYKLFVRNERALTLFSQGINQSTSGTDKGNAIINCHLLTGRMGRPGMGPFSITGQPNAMGGREVGGLSNQLTAHLDIANPAHRDLVQRFWRSPVIAPHEGLKAVDLFEAVGSGKVKALWIMATNPAVSLPNADRVREAISQCAFTVISDCVATTDTAKLCDLRLPALTWGERDGTVTNSERCISRQKPFLAPPGLARPDWWIITQVARKMGYGTLFPYESPSEIFREHASLSTFENNGERLFNIGGLARISDSEYDRLDPVQWPVSVDAVQPVQAGGTARLFANGGFSTPDRKARFVAITPRPPATTPDRHLPYVLNTGRVRDHWHTMTRTGCSPRLSAHRFEPFVEIHPDDALVERVQDGDLARVSSPQGEMLARVSVSDRQRKGSVFVPMHWTDGYASKARVGALIAPETDPVSGQPESKGSAAGLKPYQPAWHGFVLTRQLLDAVPCEYWARSRWAGFWRYELAGDKPVDDWSSYLSGLVRRKPDHNAWMDYWDQGAGQYRAAQLNGERLEACAFFGPQVDLPPRNWLIGLFHKEQLEQRERSALLSGCAPAGEADQGRIICACNNVGEKTILQAINDGATTTEAIGRVLNAGTNCGSCLPEIRDIISQKRQ